MNELDAITTILQSRQKEWLKEHVETARKMQNQAFDFSARRDGLSSTRTLFRALHSLGFVDLYSERGDGKNHYCATLLPAAFQRIDYEEKSKLGQWWKRTWLQHTAWMGIAGFFISVLLALVKVAQILGIL